MEKIDDVQWNGVHGDHVQIVLMMTTGCEKRIEDRECESRHDDVKIAEASRSEALETCFYMMNINKYENNIKIPRVKSTMLYIVRLHDCIEVDVSRSHVVFKTLTCLHMCVHSQGTR